MNKILKKSDDWFLDLGRKLIKIFGKRISAILIVFSIPISFYLLMLSTPFLLNDLRLMIFSNVYFFVTIKLLFLGYNRDCAHCGNKFALVDVNSSFYKCDFCHELIRKNK